ncbi:MAG: hypothetical protein K5923_01820 [Clostridia bacterium]|nr:hypothetical protein [Clostridia bacterium]
MNNSEKELKLESWIEEYLRTKSQSEPVNVLKEKSDFVNSLLKQMDEVDNNEDIKA